jgi:hypothetical protein
VIRFSLEKGETNSTQILKDKLVSFYQASQLPTKQELSSHLQQFVDARNAVQVLQNRDRLMYAGQLTSQIKKCRL